MSETNVEMPNVAPQPQPNVATEQQAAPQQPAETQSAEATALNIGDRHFFKPQQANEAQTFVQQIAQTDKYVVTYQGTEQEPWPTGAGCAVLPIARREDKINERGQSEGKHVVQYGVLVWPYFPPETLIGDAFGSVDKDTREYLESLIESDQAARILNPLRKQEITRANIDVSSLPRTVKDHLEGVQTAHGMLKAYNEIAGDFIKALREKSPAFKPFTPQLLRSYLQSAEMARSFNAALEEKGFWTMLLDKMETAAQEKGLSTAVFKHWREQRDEADKIDLENLDIADLSI